MMTTQFLSSTRLIMIGHAPQKLWIICLALAVAMSTVGCELLNGGGDDAASSGSQAQDEAAGEAGADDDQARLGPTDRPTRADGTPAPTRPDQPQFRNPGDGAGNSGDGADERSEYQEWLETREEQRRAANERRRRNSGGSGLGAPRERQRIPASVAGDISDRQLDRFGRAVESVAKVYEDQDYEEQMMEADSYEEVAELQAGIEEEMRKRIEESGLSYEEYLGLSQRLENEPELQRRLAELVGTSAQTEYLRD